MGKSFITIFLAAHVTTGEPWPDFQTKEIEKGKSIILTAEDGLADTAGADASKISVLEGTQIAGELKHFSLLRDIPRLEELLKKKGDIKLMVRPSNSLFEWGRYSS